MVPIAPRVIVKHRTSSINEILGVDVASTSESGSKKLEIAGPAINPKTIPVIPPIIPIAVHSSINWDITLLLVNPIAFINPISFVRSLTVYIIRNNTIKATAIISPNIIV